MPGGDGGRVPERIVSGGQTGVDRAALDVALELGLPCGGWCPAGRWAEDGPIDPRYPLRETPSAEPAQRTAWNVRDSEATLVFSPEPLTGGTASTVEEAERLGRAYLVVDPFSPAAVDVAGEWLRRLRPRVLNVAGPRESTCPGVGDAVREALRDLLSSSVA